MRVLVTGATGWIGTAVVPELIGAGHSVIGLARSDASAAALVDAGAEAVRGSLEDLEALRSAAEAADGVVHLAFKNEEAFAGDFAAAAVADRNAIASLGAALEGSRRPLIVTTGLAAHPSGTHVTEDDPADTTTVAGERMLAEEMVRSLAASGVRSASVRLSPSVHGKGDPGFAAVLVAIAREKGVSAYIGDGQNHWPAVHRRDAARLFRLALEKAPAGSVLHGAAEEGVPFRAIAEAIGRSLDVPTASIAPEQAVEHFGWMAGFAALDIRASSTKTRERVGWEPTQPGLVQDIEQGEYLPAAA